MNKIVYGIQNVSNRLKLLSLRVTMFPRLRVSSFNAF